MISFLFPGCLSTHSVPGVRAAFFCHLPVPHAALEIQKDCIMFKSRNSGEFMIYKTVFLTAALATSVFSQVSLTGQSRAIFHYSVDVSEKFYATGWVLGNLAQDQPSNINALLGAGYRRVNWWAEAMVQRQWSGQDRVWLLDLRFAGSHSRWNFYGEVAPILGRGALYDMGTVEYSVGKGLAFGVETENVHRRGPDDWSLGPRISKTLPK